MRVRQFLAVLLLPAISAAPPIQTKPVMPHLLVLGVPHFANHHRDLINSNVEDVLTQVRQREMMEIVSALAALRPNHVAVEWSATKQAALDERYAAYRAGKYVLTGDEIDQIGLRLAAMLNLPRVDAVNWLEQAPGNDDDYDFGKWLEVHGRSGELSAITADGQRRVNAQDKLNRCRPIAEWLRDLNSPEYVAWDESTYYRIATFGDAKMNPGAAWVGAWHARNLRIAANLKRVAGAAGDRTVAVSGAGHANLLRRYGAGMGFSVLDTNKALPRPGKPTC
ncbi:DUF5694 domain-containing protein [Sphingomonas aerophila]|uniref:Uncharacterized protein n=1 Tax=Sphingomonas aerophila TaxID=1344948 RepID=A0A7W9ESK6_9SPHN|nr:DUF5694 domain-containing protein [Sphingomonas aerophila]MBB5713209.1 hypothetical protein [Sphingomonas aerophila]